MKKRQCIYIPEKNTDISKKSKDIVINIINVKNIGFIKVYLFKDVQQNKILMVMREKNGVKYNPRVTKS